MKKIFFKLLTKLSILKKWRKEEEIDFGLIDFLQDIVVIVYYWIMVFYYFFSPANAYDVNIKIEEHAFETYSKYLKDNPNDQRTK